MSEAGIDHPVFYFIREEILNSSTGRNIAIGILLVLLAAVVFRNAWLGDDAFITYRTVDNFVNGNGLTWNTIERVQGYTHPLWMLLVSAAYAVTHEIFLTVIFLSMVLTLAAAALFAFRLSMSLFGTVIGLGLILISKPFIDFATSGLENPLTYLLIVIFYILYFKSDNRKIPLFFASLLASLTVLNRMDTILLLLPALFHLFIKRPSFRALLIMILGFTPFILWTLFSMVYYGFPFANTAYAKLNTGIDSLSLIEQGIHYCLNFVSRSPAAAIALIGAVVISLAGRSAKEIAAAIGIVLYGLYIIKIGGDFMTGRFFAAPFLVAVIIFSRHKWTVPSAERISLYAALVIFGLLWPRCPVWSGGDFGSGPEKKDWDHGISDERAVYFQDNSLLKALEADILPQNDWADDGRLLREEGRTVIYECGNGFRGFCAGPQPVIVDCHALTDPLLARMPVIVKKYWRIGHFRRMPPDGYFETLKTGLNKIEDRDLRQYYDKLNILTRGKIFNISRLKEIIKFNFGRYDYLMERYLNRPLVKLRYDDVRKRLPRGTRFGTNATHIMSESGVVVMLDNIVHDAGLEISVEHNNDYIIYYYLDSTLLYSQDCNTPVASRHELRIDSLYVPHEVIRKGYNKIIIKPVAGDGVYCLGHVVLLGESFGLDELGDAKRHSMTNRPDWTRAVKFKADHDLSGMVALAGYDILKLDDLLYFKFHFRVKKDLGKTYKVKFHVVTVDENKFINSDFLPDLPTGLWRKGDEVECRTVIMNPGCAFNFALSLFNPENTLKLDYRGVVDPNEL